MDCDQADRLKEIAELRANAQWYRRWAEAAPTASERAARLRLALELEKKALGLISGTAEEQR